jgi:hypothetical protein
MINPAELSPEFRIPDAIRDLQRQVAELKTKQRIGGDNIIVEPSFATALISDTFSSGQYRDYTITYTPLDPILGLPQLAMTHFIQVENNDGYLWPKGASLSLDQQAMEFRWHLDFRRSDDSIGMRIWSLRIYNPSATAHTVYGQYRIYNIRNPNG